MNSLIVFESMFGNTEVVARAIGDGLGQYGPVTTVNVAHDAPVPDGTTDLVVVGGPTHALSMTRANTRADAAHQGADMAAAAGIGIREWIEALSGGNRALVATFDTRMAKPRVPGSAARAALRRLKRLGFRPAAPAETFWVDGIKGPLGPGEAERARQWAIEFGRAASEKNSRSAATG
jgi:flavodoxin